MCGRLVNLDTVARVLAEYYHLKTDTQLAALDEALSRVPAETVGNELFGNSEQLESSSCGHEKDHVADPGKMVGDLISRQDAIALLEEAESAWLKGDILLLYPVMLKGLKKLPSAQQWISCEERLPKDYESVNVTVRIPEGRYVKESAFLNGVWIGVSAPAEVVAWCPLPKAWKGEEND